jgi:carbon-monoxide dehydrogenase medium subunit
MKPAPFIYSRARSAEHAATLLADAGSLAEPGCDVRILAGGQSLVPMMNFRMVTPARLIDLNGAAAELSEIRRDGDRVAVGAIARQSAVEHSELVAELVPLLSEGVTFVAHPPIRHRGTVVGSLAHAAAVAELPCVALTLDAELTLLSADGVRIVPAVEFFTGAFQTACRRDELVTSVSFPVLKAHTGQAYTEYSPRHGNFPFAGAAVTISVEGGVVTDVAIGLCGISDRPVRATAAENALRSAVVDDDLIRHAASLATSGIEKRPNGDVAAHIIPVKAAPVANWEYRARVARTQVRRALETAIQRAGEAS